MLDSLAFIMGLGSWQFELRYRMCSVICMIGEGVCGWVVGGLGNHRRAQKPLWGPRAAFVCALSSTSGHLRCPCIKPGAWFRSLVHASGGGSGIGLGAQRLVEGSAQDGVVVQALNGGAGGVGGAAVDAEGAADQQGRHLGCAVIEARAGELFGAVGLEVGAEGSRVAGAQGFVEVMENFKL